MPWRLVDPQRSPRLRTALHVLAGLSTGLLLVGMIVVTASIYELVDAVRQTQVDNTDRAAKDRARDERTADTAADAARAAQRIEDCTTPGRECFRASQQRLRKTVGSINDYALAAAACADKPAAQTIVELEACIRRKIEQPPEDR